jgi:integrase/recombinase XerD
MTPLANHVSVFLRQRLPIERRASDRTSATYALALRLFVEFASERLKVRPSALQLEQLDAPLVQEFLTHLETQRHNRTMSRALLKMRSGRCHVYSTSSCCFVKHLFV